MLRSLGEVAVTEATASPYAGRGVPATARVPPSLGGPTKVGCEDPCAMVHPQSPWQCGSSGPIRSVCFIYGPAERTLTEVSFQLTVFWPQGPQPGCWEADSDNQSRSIASDSLSRYGLYSPWKPPGQNTGVGSLSLL